jgi:glycosyltransferase involved in cell wall biosynthesis
VLHVYVKRPFIREVLELDPDIIHYIPGRSVMSFAVTKLLQQLFRRACIVLSLLRPNLSSIGMRLLPALKPDVVLVQSKDTEVRLARLGFTTRFLPSGVDLSKFRPVCKDRSQLRERYGFRDEDFIILHVGHLRKNRGLEIFSEMSRLGNKVVIVADTTMRFDNNLRTYLRDSGCIVRMKIMPCIEDMYRLSDCYVFPVKDSSGSIEAPLSVMEAMACNLPVITFPFGALPRMFTPGDGLFFVGNESGMLDALCEVRNSLQVRTRKKVLPYSWHSVAKRLNDIYSETRTRHFQLHKTIGQLQGE